MPPPGYSEDFFKGPACALVVGISNYKHGQPPGQALEPMQFNNLKLAAKDAQDFASFLTNYGLLPACVQCLIDDQATLRNIMMAFSKLRKDCKVADEGKKPLVFIFFSGHGMTDSDGEHFLMTYDGESDGLAGTALWNDDFQSRVRQLNTDRLVIFLDACHSGGMRPKDAKAVQVKYHLPTDLGEGTGRCLIASCKAEQLSWEGENNSIFTHHLLDVLENGTEEILDEEINVLNLSNVLKRRVREAANRLGHDQEPEFNMSQSTGLVLAINKWRRDRIIETNQKIRRFVESIAQWLTKKNEPKRVTISQKLRNYVDNRRKEVGFEDFYVYFDEQVESELECAHLDDVCYSLCSLHKRGSDSIKSSSSTQTPSRPIDQFTTVLEPTVGTPEKFVPPVSQVSSPANHESRYQLAPEDQQYVLDEIQTKLNCWLEARLLAQSLSHPICEAEFTKLIHVITNRNPAITDAMVAEIVKRFQEKFPKAAVSAPQTLSSVMINR